MAYTDIDDPTIHFNIKLYTGNNTGQSITGVGFQPDWVWIKSRTDANSHNSWDIVRGVNKYLENDTTKAETTVSNGLTAFGTDGFTVGDRDAINDNGLSFVAWCWKAGNSSGSSNSDGSQNTTVSVNTTAGFSIVKWTGADSTGSLGHGLGAVPKMIIAKRLATRNWTVYHVSMGANKKLFLNTTDAETSIADFDATPTSSVINVGYTDDTNGSGSDYIGYAFVEKKGYSKFSQFVGNGNSDGVFVYCGFKPAWVMFKGSSASGNHWQIYDTKRNTFNVIDDLLRANLSNAENTNDADESIDIVSNGFKCRGTSNNNNNHNGVTYVFMAFAESPFVNSKGVPTTAR
nr:hypothetical protein [uncultured Mediterranean phage uvMED]